MGALHSSGALTVCKQRLSPNTRITWGTGSEWETTFFDITQIWCAQCGLFSQVHRAELDIYDNIERLAAAAGRPVPPLVNVPNQYLRPKPSDARHSETLGSRWTLNDARALLEGLHIPADMGLTRMDSTMCSMSETPESAATHTGIPLGRWDITFSPRALACRRIAKYAAGGTRV